MNNFIKIVLVIIAASFLSIGLVWLIEPGFVAGQLGMPLLTALGLSTQIGDLASFFLTLGTCVCVALFTKSAVWLYPPAMLVGFAAVGRIMAWAFYGAVFAVDMILVEVVLTAILLYAAKHLRTNKVSMSG